MTLVSMSSSLVNNAIDRLFQETKFTTDLDRAHDYIGEINFQSDFNKTSRSFINKLFKTDS